MPGFYEQSRTINILSTAGRLLFTDYLFSRYLVVSSSQAPAAQVNLEFYLKRHFLVCQFTQNIFHSFLKTFDHISEISSAREGRNRSKTRKGEESWAMTQSFTVCTVRSNCIPAMYTVLNPYSIPCYTAHCAPTGVAWPRLDRRTKVELQRVQFWLVTVSS